jgi:hypothetical protein
MVKSLRKVKYEKLTVKVYQDDKALTVDDMKKLLGWRAETDPGEKEAFGDNYKFKDMEGTKIRLDNCTTNRPFRRGLALYYANEMLRQKWRLNGETIVFDVTDDCQEGQHRGVGFIFAEQMRKKNPEHWKIYGTKSPVTMETIVVFGIGNSDDVVDTLNLGQKRSLGDVLFRNKSFEDATDKEQTSLANTLAAATRCAWICMGGKLVSDAPKFPHSEALDFIDKHPGMLDCVSHVTIEDAGTEKQIRSMISLGYAAAMCYLMGTSATNSKKYDAGEAEPDLSLMEEAEKFWTLVAQGADLETGHPALVLRKFLTAANAGSGHERDEIIAACKIAWNTYMHDPKKPGAKKLDGVKDLKVARMKIKGTDKTVIDMPYMGGLDVKREAPPKPEKAPKTPKTPKTPKAKKSKKGGKPVKYAFKAGDEVYVQPTGIDEETKKAHEVYKGRVVEIKTGGAVVVHPEGTEKDFLCELSPQEGDYVGLEKPKK